MRIPPFRGLSPQVIQFIIANETQKGKELFTVWKINYRLAQQSLPLGEGGPPKGGSDEGKSGSTIITAAKAFRPGLTLISQKSKIFANCELWCACHRQAIDFDSLRGAPPQGKPFGRSRASAPLVS